ncbi:hypothetical protein GE09DRAFT_1058173 [Coniochaeta sp. 2T2.1]|nr:hypothetical protein GE09DRAFT_1058173 [Coniochaeta sp. 2T2.1]
MKTTAILALALGSLPGLVNADVVFQVGGPDGTFAVAQVDQGDQVLTSKRNNPLFKNAINAVVLNAGETLNGLERACGCVGWEDVCEDGAIRHDSRQQVNIFQSVDDAEVGEAAGAENGQWATNEGVADQPNPRAFHGFQKDL